MSSSRLSRYRQLNPVCGDTTFINISARSHPNRRCLMIQGCAPKAIFDLYVAVTFKACEIQPKLLLVINRKSYYARSIGGKFDDLEPTYNASFLLPICQSLKLTTPKIGNRHILGDRPNTSRWLGGVSLHRT